nr:Chain B, Epstein-Barr nuclear antigen 1 [Human herpesvirus 4 strain B95-8]5WUN_C Chain C, Epstein-Barr nuclear antigen 1 [Human herpesvirus 4 strain B95-8]
EKRPRSPSS